MSRAFPSSSSSSSIPCERSLGVPDYRSIASSPNSTGVAGLEALTASQPRGRGVQFRQFAVLQYSITPSLHHSIRSPGFDGSLPYVASRSFRRRGEVGRTSTKRLVVTRRSCLLLIAERLAKALFWALVAFPSHSGLRWLQASPRYSRLVHPASNR